MGFLNNRETGFLWRSIHPNIYTEIVLMQIALKCLK